MSHRLSSSCFVSGAAIAVLGAACGVVQPIVDAGTSGSESTSGGMSPTTTPGASGPGESADSGGTTTIADTGASEVTTAELDASGGDVVFDVGAPDMPPVSYGCSASPAQAVDLEIMTPSGPFAATHAWWAWSYCCIAVPRLVLSEGPEIDVLNFQSTTPHVLVSVQGTWEHEGPLVDAWPVVLRDVDGSDDGDPQDGLVLLDALDPEVQPKGELPFLSATFAIDGGGWSITGSVTAPYCGDIEYPSCPCE